MAEKWLKVETARKLLKNTCKEFLKEDKSGVADFRIPSKEAFLLWIYTHAAYYLGDSYSIESNRDFLYTAELIKFVETTTDTFYPLYKENIPTISNRLSSYFQLFFNPSSKKYLFLIDKSKSDKPLENISKKIVDNGINPMDCLLWISRTQTCNGETYGCYSESNFWEYFSGVILSREGYFISPFSLGGGDIFAYKIPDYLEKLQEKNLIGNGAFVEELEMLGFDSQTKKVSRQFRGDEVDFICVEAESSDSKTKNTDKKGWKGVNQVRGYLNGKNKNGEIPKCGTDPEGYYFRKEYHPYFSNGYVAGPYVNREFYWEEIGLISCTVDGDLIFNKPIRSPIPMKKVSINAIKRHIRYSLLRNLSYEEICEIIGLKNPSLKDYFERIRDLDIDDILDKIEEKLG